MVLLILSVRVAEYKAAVGITELVCAVRIELSTRVTCGDVHLRKVAPASDLDIIRGLHEMRALHEHKHKLDAEGG